MNYHPLEELVAIARSGSSFYGKLYEKLPNRGYRFEDIPIATFESVMEAVHGDYRALFSSEAPYGMCYTTSGTTGAPKATLFGRDEWRTTNQALSLMHWKNGVIRDGDVICNLSEPGSASFMAIHRVVDAFPGRCSEIPLGCDRSYASILPLYRQFGATVIAGMSPTLLGLAATLLHHGQSDPRIERLLGGGELFYGAQLDILRAAFPNAKFCPFMYGATEAGLIGYGDLESGDNQFRVFDGICRLEIIDPETSKEIRTPHRVGKVAITSFVRLAAPAIRLETGDLAEWIDDPASPSPRFSLRGRRFPFARHVAGVQLREDEIWRLVRLLEPKLRMGRLQMVVRDDAKDPRIEVVVWLHDQTISPTALEGIVLDALAMAAPELSRALRQGVLSAGVRTVTWPYFEPTSRRKSRLIADDVRASLNVTDAEPNGEV